MTRLMDWIPSKGWTQPRGSDVSWCEPNHGQSLIQLGAIEFSAKTVTFYRSKLTMTDGVMLIIAAECQEQPTILAQLEGLRQSFMNDRRLEVSGISVTIQTECKDTSAPGDAAAKRWEQVIGEVIWVPRPERQSSEWFNLGLIVQRLQHHYSAR